jgi:hypothetical protein
MAHFLFMSNYREGWQLDTDEILCGNEYDDN